MAGNSKRERRPAERASPGSWRGLSHRVQVAFGRVEKAVNRGPVRRTVSAQLARGRELTHTRLELARGGAGLSGLRIAFLSDVHAGNFFYEPDWLEVCTRVAEAEPDLVCLGGDLINLHTDEILELRKGLAALAPPLGKFAVPGNHEYYPSRDLTPWRSVLEDAGVEVLRNRGVRIERAGASLWLAGVDDLLRGRPDLDSACAGRSDDEPTVLLAHNPDFFAETAHAGVDLQLSGHTHGGQVRLFGRTPLRHTRLGYWSGHFARGAAQLYVSRGVGVSLLPLRIGASAEIALVELATPR